MPKYHNSPTEFEGIKFDSRKECKRYQQLRLMESAGEITDLQRQVKYILIPSQYEQTSETYKRGHRKGQLKRGPLIEKEVSYYADFVYRDKDGRMVVEDTKGMKTDKYIIKRKLMLYVFGIRITEL